MEDWDGVRDTDLTRKIDERDGLEIERRRVSIETRRSELFGVGINDEQLALNQTYGWMAGRGKCLASS